MYVCRRRTTIMLNAKCVWWTHQASDLQTSNYFSCMFYLRLSTMFVFVHTWRKTECRTVDICAIACSQIYMRCFRFIRTKLRWSIFVTNFNLTKCYKKKIHLHRFIIRMAIMRVFAKVGTFIFSGLWSICLKHMEAYFACIYMETEYVWDIDRKLMRSEKKVGKITVWK